MNRNSSVHFLDFDGWNKNIIEALPLLGKTVEQSMTEVLQEEELLRARYTRERKGII